MRNPTSHREIRHLPQLTRKQIAFACTVHIRITLPTHSRYSGSHARLDGHNNAATWGQEG